jgi:NADPH-dependent 2,4-dienoyl-CoA reductase/sulfur reductase-like enzyme
VRVVVLGNGVAGWEAARAAAHAPGAQVTVVSEESERFFSRPGLLYALAGQLREADLCPADRPADRAITRRRDRAIGVTEGALQLTAGELPFDALVLAPGSRPRPAPWPGAHLRGVGHFVTRNDLRWLSHALHGDRAAAPPDGYVHPDDSPYRPRPPVARPRHPVVVGGGLVGIEVVEALLAAGLRPTFLLRGSWFWDLALDAREAGWIAERLRDHGATVRVDTPVAAFLPHPDQPDRIGAVRCADETLACDLAVVAIGVVPNTDWLAGSALDRTPEGGIPVDDRLRTRLPGVWAAGDAAAVPPDHQTQTLWYTARDQGRIAGANAVGGDLRYAPDVPYNAAKLMDTEYTTVGALPPDAPAWWFEERGAVRSTLRIAADAEDRVIGMNALGRRWDTDTWRRWIAERRPRAWVLDHLHDAGFDTEGVPPIALPAEAR